MSSESNFSFQWFGANFGNIFFHITPCKYSLFIYKLYFSCMLKCLLTCRQICSLARALTERLRLRYQFIGINELIWGEPNEHWLVPNELLPGTFLRHSLEKSQTGKTQCFHNVGMNFVLTTVTVCGCLHHCDRWYSV